MQNNQLPADVHKRIEQDAKEKYTGHSTLSISNRNGYIAGATAEAQWTQGFAEILPELKDTIEWMWEHMKEADGQTLLQVDHFNRPANALHIIENALQQWKERKEVGNG